MAEPNTLAQTGTPTAGTTRRRRKRSRIPLTGWLGIVLVAAPGLVAIFAPLLLLHPPAEIDPTRAMIPPLPLEGSTMTHPLGTDNLGRDMLSRVIQGSRISLLVGVLAVVLAGTIGLTVGLTAGYCGGIIDAILMRIVDALLAIPSILLVLVVLGVLNPGVNTLIVVLGFTSWVIYARQIRSEVLEIRERQFIKAAVNFGVPGPVIIVRHLLPNVLPSFTVLSALSVATIIVMESALSFLGLGVQPPEVSWGIMLTTGRDYLASAWWISTFPGLAITFTVLGFLLLGDWLRDALDPRLAVRK